MAAVHVNWSRAEVKAALLMQKNARQRPSDLHFASAVAIEESLGDIRIETS
jgi:hypothetical protein